MQENPHILIIGGGSAGKRHARNLRSLGCRISAMDPRADRLDECRGEGPLEAGYTTVEEALRSSGFDGYVIASPPNFHVPQILEVLTVDAGARILCEKPLSVSATEALRLQPHAARILLGYTYRWWPPLREMRRRLQEGEIGTVRTMRFVMSAHLADWHPWENYTDFFMANKEMGGGALLDESHFLDLMRWFLGEASSLSAHVDKVSDLQIDADDCVDIIVRCANGARVNLHLDLIGRPHERSIRAMGDDGTMIYEYENNTLSVGKEAAPDWQQTRYDCERNDMFMGVARDYLTWLNDGGTPPVCGYEDGLRALQLVDACRISSESGSLQRLAKGSE